jgi:hypothetical protein
VAFLERASQMARRGQRRPVAARLAQELARLCLAFAHTRPRARSAIGDHGQPCQASDDADCLVGAVERRQSDRDSPPPIVGRRAQLVVPGARNAESPLVAASPNASLSALSLEVDVDRVRG